MRNCPRCAIELDQVANHGVEIDYCTTCGGIWLDHGELEKLIGLAKRKKQIEVAKEKLGERKPSELNDESAAPHQSKMTGWDVVLDILTHLPF